MELQINHVKDYKNLSIMVNPGNDLVLDIENKIFSVKRAYFVRCFP